MTRKPKTIRLWQEIFLALALKVFLLIFIWLAWFSTPEDHDIDAEKIASRLYSQQSQ